MPQIFSNSVWQTIRVLSIISLISLLVLLYYNNELGLFIFWRIIIPLLPMILFLSPGLWRNICALSALNQTPRNFGLTKDNKLAQWIEKYSFLMAVFLFLLFVSMRKIFFNTNAYALTLLILFLAFFALIMGIFYKGKSGWCSTFCPVMPVERLYGQSPIFKVKNTHKDCIGCTKNCFDVCPDITFLKELYHKDQFFYNSRKFFAGIFPGFVLGFYLIPDPPQISIIQMYLSFIIYCGVSVLLLYCISYLFFKKIPGIVISVFGVMAINFYYWFNIPMFIKIFASLDNTITIVFVWLLRLFVFGLTILWIKKTYIKENAYIAEFLTKKK